MKYFISGEQPICIISAQWIYLEIDKPEEYEKVLWFNGIDKVLISSMSHLKKRHVSYEIYKYWMPMPNMPRELNGTN